MASRSMFFQSPRRMATALAVILGLAPLSSQPVHAQTLNLRGVAGTVCTLTVTADPSGDNLNLPIAVDNSPHTVTVGSVRQDCNYPTGYQLTVTDVGTQCNATPAPLGVGAKLFDGTTHYLAYSVNSINPGPVTVSGLLAAACTGQVMRDVGTTVINSLSSVQVAFTANSALASGTYTDILTFTLTTH